MLIIRTLLLRHYSRDANKTFLQDQNFCFKTKTSEIFQDQNQVLLVKTKTKTLHFKTKTFTQCQII